jgi:hypothetical protein
MRTSAPAVPNAEAHELEERIAENVVGVWRRDVPYNAFR